MGEQITVQIEHHQKVLLVRRFDRLIQSYEFGDAWTVANQQEKKHARKLIHNGSYDLLQEWVNKILYVNFETHTVRQLRNLASRYHVPYYSRMLHADLVRALNQKGITDENNNNVVKRDETNSRSGGCTYQTDSTSYQKSSDQNSYECL